jgi:hypothetical protein
MVRTEREMTGIFGPVLFTTYPSPAGFLNRYILSLTPLVLVALSLIVLTFMRILVSSSLPSLGKPIAELVPDFPAVIGIFVLLISPIGIFLFFIYLGDLLHRTELWTGATLTLLLSIAGALVLVQGLNTVLLSTDFLFTLLLWTAYLVQPFSIIAAAMVLVGIELFRRSIRYTITREALIITGGIWNQVENIIPLHHGERIIVVQGWTGRFFHTGTVVPQGLVYGNRDFDMREHSLTGDRAPPGPTGHTLPWQEGSHDPLICLFGVRDPEKVRIILEKAHEIQAEKNPDRF